MVKRISFPVTVYSSTPDFNKWDVHSTEPASPPIERFYDWQGRNRVRIVSVLEQPNGTIVVYYE